MACLILTLGGVELNPNMVWRDRAITQGVAQRVIRTLAGGLVVFTQQLTAGAEVTLSATNDQGWLTKVQVDQVRALAEIPGAQYTLSIGAESLNVMFRHSDPPAFDAALLIERLNPVPGDYYTVNIKLLTV